MIWHPQALEALASAVAGGRRAHLVGIFPSPPITLEAFESLLADPAFPARHVRLVREGDVIPAKLYTDEHGAVRAAAVRKLYGQDISVALDRLDKLVPEVQALADALAARIGKRVSANSYLTGGGRAALKPHHDDHDVLAVQIAGAKRWYCYGPKANLPAGKGPLVEIGARPPEWEVTVGASDVLYLPCGEAHCAAPVATPSLHLTLGIWP